MAQFDLMPPGSDRSSSGVVVSVLVHVVLLVPLFLRHRPAPTHQDPIEQLVVFLVPPDQGVSVRGDKGVPWSGEGGTHGATTEPLPKVKKPEEVIPVGTAGEQVYAESEAAAPEAVPEVALTEIEVDSAVVRDPTSAAPVYPPNLLAKNIEGNTFVHYVVDTVGVVDTSTIQVVRTSHPDFSKSVREALKGMKFRPAIQSSHRVRQWVEQNFSFRIVPPKAKPAKDST